MDLIQYSAKGNIAVLTINRPEAMNALNNEVLQKIAAALQGVNTNTIRCLIITGIGQKAFAAGADIAQMANGTKADGKAYSQLGNDICRMLEQLPIPTIAAINGYALGGGCELTLCCDIRLASEKAVFGLPEVGLGITPGFGGTQRLARLIGVGKAKELIYTARNIKASEALASGLVQAVYSPDELMVEAKKMAKQIANNAPIAVRLSKQSIDKGLQKNQDDGIALEIENFSNCFETLDQVEGMAAFLEKRPHNLFINC